MVVNIFSSWGQLQNWEIMENVSSSAHFLSATKFYTENDVTVWDYEVDAGGRADSLTHVQQWYLQNVKQTCWITALLVKPMKMFNGFRRPLSTFYHVASSVVGLMISKTVLFVLFLYKQPCIVFNYLGKL